MLGCTSNVGRRGILPMFSLHFDVLSCSSQHVLALYLQEYSVFRRFFRPCLACREFINF